MLARLESASQRIARFTADASHELRTPASVIPTDAEISLSKPCSADEYRLIEQLLVLERVNAGSVALPIIFPVGSIVFLGPTGQGRANQVGPPWVSQLDDGSPRPTRERPAPKVTRPKDRYSKSDSLSPLGEQCPDSAYSSLE